MTLERDLAQAVAVYADLLDASLPGRSGEPSNSAPDPRDKPAPGSLTVLDHRHELVRGLRWWVDAVHEHGQPTPRMGSDVRLMATYLVAHLHVMADEDAAELAANIRGWLRKAAGMMGAPDSPPVVLTPEAWDRVLPQSVAAQALGVPVSTIWRRAGGRGGAVRLGDVTGPRCEPHDLLLGQCADCAVSA